jgi:hypothetical protein
MGQYLQLGICHRIDISKRNIDKLGVTLEQIKETLSEKMDISLYECMETDEQVQFILKESIALNELHGFLQQQFALYPQDKSDTQYFDEALNSVSKASSLMEIEELAQSKSMHCFQYSRISDEIKVSSWHKVHLDFSLFVMFVEGKIYMEGYNALLKFIENQVRISSKEWSIAGAFRAFIE